jgi:phosphatidyl-myo-inositol dimannoside synthase
LKLPGGGIKKNPTLDLMAIQPEAMKPKILFISRNYPPKLGGLETYSYNLIKEFEKDFSVFKIVLRKSILNLVWFLPFSFFKALFLNQKHSFSNIHLCDGLLAPVGVLLKCFTRASVSVSIHGLDVTYKNLFYQWLIPRCVGKLNKIICVSRSTREECLRRCIPGRKCRVIPNGIQPDEFYFHRSPEELRGQLEKSVNICLKNKKILITIGRLIKRKGIIWFVDRVMPELDDSYLYIIAGQGPEFEPIDRKVKERDLLNQVLMLGRISEKFRRLIYNAADIFIMPNITVEGDAEGFGIVVIEAGSCGLPVVASKIQGLRDAVIEGKTGYLIEEGDADGFVERIKNMDLKKEVVRSCVNEVFDWTTIYRRYQNTLI